MRIVNRGFLLSKKLLPEVELPENAVEFKEPENQFNINIPTFIFIFLFILAIALIFSIAQTFRGPVEIDVTNPGAILGFIMGFVSIMLQGFIKGSYYKKDSVVYLFYSWRGVYVRYYEPVPKMKFITMELLPSVFLGWAPLIIAAFIPLPALLHNFVLVWGFVGALFSCGFYINALNAARQVPTDGMVQVSGPKFYWFRTRPHAAAE